MKNHANCSCTFVKNVSVNTDYADLNPSEDYSAQIWKTPGGISYLRVFYDPTKPFSYHRMSLDRATIIESQ